MTLDTTQSPGRPPAAEPRASRVKPPIFRLLAEFEHTEDLIEAARKTYDAGYRRIDAYTPFPVEGLSDALRTRPSKLPFIVLIGGLVGCVGGYFMQYYAAVLSYPINVGGRRSE